LIFLSRFAELAFRIFPGILRATGIAIPKVSVHEFLFPDRNDPRMRRKQFRRIGGAF
jgi:hypothetical protein